MSGTKKFKPVKLPNGQVLRSPKECSQWIAEQHYDERRTIVEISEEIGKSYHYVHRRIRDDPRHFAKLMKFPRKERKTTPWELPDGRIITSSNELTQWMLKQYTDQKLTVVDIARMVGVTSKAVTDRIANDPEYLQERHRRLDRQHKRNTGICALDGCEKTFSTTWMKQKYCSVNCSAKDRHVT